MKRARSLGGAALIIVLLWSGVAFGAPVEVIGELNVTDDHDNGILGAIVFGDGSKQWTAASVRQVDSGFGLMGGPIKTTGTLSVNTNLIQARVAGSCAAGTYMTGVDVEGGVYCQTDANSGGTVQWVTAGTGLSGLPSQTITTTGTLSVNFAGTGSATTAAKSDHTHDYNATFVNVTGDTMTGSLTLSGTGTGVVFPDGSKQTTAVSGGGGGVPPGFMILGDTSTAPSGYTYTGKTLGMPGSWAEKADMPTGRAGAATAVVNNKVYVIGGHINAPTGVATNEEYDPVTDSWATKADMLTARTVPKAGVVNNKIYVIGGFTGSTLFATNEEYDPVANIWTPKASALTARQGVAVGVVNNKIYVIGGFNASGTALATNEEYDPTSNAWSAKAAMPTARNAPAAGVVNNKIYIIGGQSGTTVLATNEEYDPATNIWSPKASAPTATTGAGAGVVNDRIYVFGGTQVVVSPWPGISINEEFTPDVLYVHRKN